MGHFQKWSNVAWETRGGKDEYFYRSRRLSDGRIRKQYFGKGLLANVESLWLERKAAVRRQLGEERQRTAAAEALLKQHLRSTTDATHALMLSIGYTNERSRGWRNLPMIAPHESSHELADASEEGNLPSFSELVTAARQRFIVGIQSPVTVIKENPAWTSGVFSVSVKWDSCRLCTHFVPIHADSTCSNLSSFPAASFCIVGSTCEYVSKVIEI